MHDFLTVAQAAEELGIIDDDDGAATWFCRCADCGMAVIVESMTSKIGGCAYDTDCPGGPKPEDA